ncbi:hypothetical protein Taro_027745 [Colocasia esculenta]|uniref:Uncharacterized protein n=1 Tax=Colocasia esculenta TaxID=4460 RepID=A0A843VL09_COLES|nr:hypothetical protein [Colocasia esculenta]
MTLMDYRPAAAASAAILIRSVRTGTDERIIGGLSFNLCSFHLCLDRVLSCYTAYRVMVQEPQKLQRVLKLGRFWIPPGMEYSAASQSTITHSSSDAIDDPRLCSASRKRRRLALSSYSCSCFLSNKNHSDEGIF